jgi:epoxyqueuosine reductase QueG
MEKAVEEIKALLVGQCIPVFGIAKSTLMETEAQNYRCSDTLVSAKSILCIGMPFPKGVFYSKHRTNEIYWRAANIYYRNLDMILMSIARMIEEKGEIAVPVFGCFPYDVKGRGDLRGFMSLVKMAETAGIGKTGKNGLLFNSDYGPRLMLGGIITTADLPVMTWPQKDEKGCPDDCFACQEACPVDAIDKSGKVDRLACVKHSMKTPIFSYLMKTKAFDPSEAALINHVTGVDDHSMYTCINCVSKCPYC